MQFDLEDQRSLLRFVFLAPVLLDGFVVVLLCALFNGTFHCCLLWLAIEEVQQ